jgi:UDP-sulfoquinovose synthase
MLLGCDGYIGNALTQRLLMKGHTVIGVDNFARRKWVNEMKSFSATPILSMRRKYKLFKYLGDFMFYCCDVAEDPDYVVKIIKRHCPDTIVNLAHLPSGPYSQISRDHANYNLRNNVVGTNNLLWAIRENCSDAHYITIGTTGEYDHYSNIDIEEGYTKIRLNGRESNEVIYPRRPASIYHASKVASTYLIDFLARTWSLRCTDIMQAIVFGCYTDEIHETRLYSRFDSDESAGTVLNRFMVQAVLDVPLTVYGAGRHQRGFLSLNDSVQALEIAIANPAKKGHVQVWNQLSEWHSMNDVANAVQSVLAKKRVYVKINHIKSPRTEYTGDHYYKYKTDKLRGFGYKPTRTIEEEIEYVYDLLSEYKENLYPLKDVVLPKITWRDKDE